MTLTVHKHPDCSNPTIHWLCRDAFPNCKDQSCSGLRLSCDQECCCGGCCEDYPSQFKVTFTLCAEYIFYLDEIPGGKWSGISHGRAWEGSQFIKDGTLTIRIFCKDGQEIDTGGNCARWCWDACTGADNICPWSDALSTSSHWRNMATTSPYVNEGGGAPPSSCDNVCMQGATMLIESAP